MKRPKLTSLGKAVDEYLEAVVPELDREKFEKEILSSVANSFPSQQERPSLSQEDLKRLFKLMCGFHRDRLALEAMRKDGVDQDWDEVRSLIRRVSKGLAETTRHAREFSIECSRPLSSSLAKFVEEEISSLSWDLKELSRNCLAQKQLFDGIRKSTRGTNELISVLYSYLDEMFPTRKLEHRHEIAAAVLVAAGIKRDPKIDHVSNMPMALSRANRYREESYAPDPQEFDVEEETSTDKGEQQPQEMTVDTLNKKMRKRVSKI